jgi:ribosome maturation factor RimP
MTPVEQTIAEKITPGLAEMGLSIVRVRFLSGGGRPTLQVLLETIGKNEPARGASVEECAKASRYISALMDVEDFLKGAYLLEVSSPGVERPLVEEKDFIANKGRTIVVHLSTPVGESKKLTGILSHVAAGVITLTTRAEEIKVAIENIRDAHLKLSDADYALLMAQKKVN